MGWFKLGYVMFSFLYSIKKFADLSFDNYDDMNKEIHESMDGVCHFDTMKHDCSAEDLTYRPINELCNNRENPMYGNPMIAQSRIGEPVYETGWCPFVVYLSKVDFLLISANLFNIAFYL